MTKTLTRDGTHKDYAEWLEQHSHERHEAHLLARRQRAQDRRAAREGKTLGERYGDVLDLIYSFAASSAGPIERSSRSADRNFDPQQVNHLDLAYLDSDDVARLMAVAWAGEANAFLAIEQLEQAVDAHLGQAVPFRIDDAEEGHIRTLDPRLLSYEAKDKLLLKRCQGLSPEQVHEAMPQLGRPLTIRKTRKINQLDPETGYPIEKTND